jgi:hypothetical protein
LLANFNRIFQNFEEKKKKVVNILPYPSSHVIASRIAMSILVLILTRFTHCTTSLKFTSTSFILLEVILNFVFWSTFRPNYDMKRYNKNRPNITIHNEKDVVLSKIIRKCGLCRIEGYKINNCPYKE